jgi:hypothetical protein
MRVVTLQHHHFDDVGDRGGVLGIHALALRAIMEVGMSLRTVT